MSGLTILFLAVQVPLVFGRLAVLRGKLDYHTYDHDKRKLVCVSEDDDAGLIWNGNLNWKYSGYAFSDRGGDTGFHKLKNYERTVIDCDLNSYESCMHSWNSTDWSFTNSLARPMGPVLDQRWEGFQEHSNFNWYDEYRLADRLGKTGAIVVSIRGSSNAHFLLCDTENYENDFCYWIIIGGWDNTQSVIRKCADGVPHPPSFPDNLSECSKQKAAYLHRHLSELEWTTFIFTWNEETRNISVYDTEKMIMTYVDSGRGPKNTSETYYLFLRSSVPMLVRFHTYGYFHTTDSKATLTSPPLQLRSTNFCVEMLLGLCNDCQMEIALVNPSDESDKEILEIINGSTVAGAHGLPMWRSVKIDKAIPADFAKTAKVKLTPGLRKGGQHPIWSIANIRVCPPVGAVRYGVMEATQDYDEGVYYWPNVTCQKLFYGENVVVNSVADATLNLQFGDLHCPEGKVGPYCATSCDDLLEIDVDCKGTVICEKAGCTCPPGFIGKDCNAKCNIDRYGHDCKETCGWCDKQNCNYKTGVCMSGCDNSKRFNIPPFCKLGIDTLPPPEIDFINETTVRVILPAKEEYKKIPFDYKFTIEEVGDRLERFRAVTQRMNEDTTLLVGYMDDLKPGTRYRINCKLYNSSSSVSILGEWQNFTTRCTPNVNFDVDVGSTSLILAKNMEKEGLFPCPENWYELLFQNVDTGTQISRGPLTKLPYQVSNLEPYTIYKITIGKGSAVLFSRQIQTLEKAPSEVRNLKVVATSSKEMTLHWDPPQHPNGKIMKYEATLEVQTHLGCLNLKLPTLRGSRITNSTASTNIVLSDLHPYTHYTATIAAWNSYGGDESKIDVYTNETEIPTSTFSNFRRDGYTLLWDDPRDCATISGPIVARIIIDGISEPVKDFQVVQRTKNYCIKLDAGDTVIYGAEKYRARIYVTRNYDGEQNEFLYEELEFITPPKAPPAVRNLEVFEVDSQAMIMHLRWQPPLPPQNGVIQHYIVTNCEANNQFVQKVTPVEFCKLWKNYICTTIDLSRHGFQTIAVSAVNVNVSAPGKAFCVPAVEYEAAPEAPENFTVEPLGRGVVSIHWSHPWRTGGRLEKFVTTVNLISSHLRREIQASEKGMIYEHPVTEYQLEYTEKLYLLPSSKYEISIRANTNTNKYGEMKILKLETPPAIAFESELISEVCNDDSTISLHIPAVLNDPITSLTNVVVKGPHPCAHYTKLSPDLSTLVGIKYYEIAWRAATFPTNEYAGKIFTIGDNKTYAGARNCPLVPEQLYVIAVIVQTEQGSMNDQTTVAKTTSIRIGELPKRHEAWVIPITIFLLVAATAFYLYRRKRKGLLKEARLLEDMAFKYNPDNSEANSTLSNSKQFLSTRTPSESLSCTTPDVSTPATDFDQKEGRTHLVKVKDFEDYVRQAINSGLLDKQYNTFPRGQTKPWDYGKLAQNKPKNRYGNLIAYDESRVVLKELPDDPHSDYINANYIKGYKKERAYIATQGPKANTVIDFWRMIWQEGTLIICMLTNLTEGGKVKCEQYWPDIGKKKKYGDVVVLNATHNVFADYTFRTLHITCGDETRKVAHLHYTAWPDHGVPLYTHSVVTYLKKLLATPPGNGPAVVHCSAGVGRTGTIILCEICLRRAAVEGVVDVFAETESIRSQRANMVDNKQQYLLAHLALAECLLSFPTTLPCNKVLPIRIKELKMQLAIQQHRLQDTVWQDEALRPPTSQILLSERNLAKNRYPELVSAKVSRVYLKRYPTTDEDSDYISAVYVDGVRLQNQYLATQLPLPSTFNDFWRMIAEYKVELLVMLQCSDSTDATCCPIVPKSGEFKPTPYINIRMKDVTEFELYTSMKLLLIDNSEKPAREQQVTILCLTEWEPGRNQDPPPVMTLVTLWQAAERIPRGDGPTVVLCHDGVTGCGLYLALNFLLERMAVERECDVCLAVRAVRRSRPDFVESLKHMEYLYDAAITYMEYFETYANFS